MFRFKDLMCHEKTWSITRLQKSTHQHASNPRTNIVHNQIPEENTQKQVMNKHAWSRFQPGPKPMQEASLGCWLHNFRNYYWCNKQWFLALFGWRLLCPCKTSGIISVQPLLPLLTGILFPLPRRIHVPYTRNKKKFNLYSILRKRRTK